MLYMFTFCPKKVFFFSNLNGGRRNRLLKSVQHDFNVNKIVVVCRAPEIIFELATKTFWWLIENKYIYNLGMKIFYMELNDNTENFR